MSATNPSIAGSGDVERRWTVQRRRDRSGFSQRPPHRSGTSVAASRTDPGRSRAGQRPIPRSSRRRWPQVLARTRHPRKAGEEKACSRVESPPIPAQTGSAMTGLSPRRSRVRVPSLPSPKARQVGRFFRFASCPCWHQTRRPGNDYGNAGLCNSIGSALRHLSRDPSRSTSSRADGFISSA